MDLVKAATSIATNPNHNRWICPLLFLADAALCILVVWKIPYTEIDWRAYMQQITLYLSGERDYRHLHGDTGPLVYPAAHVYLYRGLHALTDSGTSIRAAQEIFIAVYLGALATAMACYARAGAPPWVMGLLVVSKRMHSVFVLRLFNDAFAVWGLLGAVALWQRRWWGVGAGVFALAVGVKMSVLLALPGVGIVLWQAMGSGRAMGLGWGMVQVQILLGYPFLATYPRSYVSRAFELTRQFKFEWTVNWRFVGEEVFLSKGFSLFLLAAHAALLLAFLQDKIWLHAPVRTALKDLIYPPPSSAQAPVSKRVSPDFVMTTVLTSLLIGCVCARSLHYQFYAYIAWSTPFLLWRSGLHPILICVLWAAQEWAWNVFPSTSLSSSIVVTTLLIPVLSIWLRMAKERDSRRSKIQDAHTD